MEKIKWSKKEWESWTQNPKQYVEKHGGSWEDADPAWKNWSAQQWKSMSEDQGKELIQKSKWSGWFWWD